MEREYTLRTLAKKAKAKLTDGYWAEVKSIKANAQKCNGFVKEEKQPYLVNLTLKREDEYYKIVCEIMDEENFVINPIGRLIDRELYDTLDEEARSRYIFELAQILMFLKKRYLRERGMLF